MANMTLNERVREKVPDTFFRTTQKSY